MLAKIYAATFRGFEPLLITVEVDGNRGVPSLVIVGLPSKATDEARQRLTSALQNSGVKIRSKRTVVNLAPADVPKHGTGFDLAMAVGILHMYGELKCDLDDALFLGELSLNGEVRSVSGCLPLVLAAKKWGYQRVFIPAANQSEVELISGLQLYAVKSFNTLLQHLRGQLSLRPLTPQPYHPAPPNESTFLAFATIMGQEAAKRALLITASGGHHLLLSGSPGIGKSILTQSLTQIFTPLTQDEALEVTQIYSVAGLNHGQLITNRPFRAPHHHISLAGLIGGGNPARPGEISLAHRGILFLDEFLEYPNHLLESLRQPLETKKITLRRAFGSVEYPAHFTLIAATNPCPCGYRFSTRVACTCSAVAIARYNQKLSGPLLDRFHLCLQVPELKKSDLVAKAPVQSSKYIRNLVANSREKQQARFTQAHLAATTLNSDLTVQQVRQFCLLNHVAQKLLNQAYDRLQLSGRRYINLIKVAQTIADLEDHDQIREEDMAEALQYR